MITNTIAGPEFNTLLARTTQAESPSEFETAKTKLLAFIDGWGAGLRHKAVEEFKAVCKYQGLVACNEKALDNVLLVSEVPRDALHDFYQIKTRTFDSNVQVPADLTPHFTAEDPDLNALLNDTAFMVTSTGNMDTGLAWAESFERVVARLKPLEVERDSVVLGQTRYRIHMIVTRVLGHDVLRKFKDSEIAAKLGSVADLARLLTGLEQEFKISIPQSARGELLMCTDQQFVELFYDTDWPAPTAEVLPVSATVEALLDRVGLESRLTQVALRHFPTQMWLHFQNTDSTFAYLVQTDDNEYDEWTDFEAEIIIEFGTSSLIDSMRDNERLLAMTYVQFVSHLISLGAK